MTTATSMPELPSPRRASDERTTLTEMLDFYRAVLERKCAGLSVEDLRRSLAPSSLTLGGLLYHMALVEDHWFTNVLAGTALPSPWDEADWDDDPDWEFTRTESIDADAIRAQFHTSVARSRASVEAVASLDRLAVQKRTDGIDQSLRWIMVHMIEEYARHCGHADLLRESIDGATGD